MFALLQPQEIGMGLTESMAMSPAASVSGFYLAHPDSQYFNVGRIGEDQLVDQAQRRGPRRPSCNVCLPPICDGFHEVEPACAPPGWLGRSITVRRKEKPS